MRRTLILALLLLSAPALAAEPHQLPDSGMTPGAVFSEVTADDICVPGYSKSVRHVPAKLKAEVFAQYGLEGNHTGYCSGPSGCEVDHLISLELGGSNDISNLWPEPYDGEWSARAKDKLENRMHKLVCNGTLPLAQVQREIATDWIAAFRKYVESDSFAQR